MKTEFTMKMYRFILSGIMILGLSLFGSAQTYNGNLYLGNQAAIDAFDYTEVTGNLTVYGATDLSPLQQIENVGGNFYFGNSNQVTTISGFDNLTYIGGRLQFQGLINLTSISGFNSLEYIDNELFVFSCPVLETFDGFNGLITMGTGNTLSEGIDFQGNPLLSSVSGFENFTTNNGYLEFRYSPLLVSIPDFTSLTHIGQFLNFRDLGLTEISGFNSLITINRDVQIVDNSFLTTISGLQSLTSIASTSGQFSIGENPVLTNVTIDAFSNLESVNGYFYVFDNAELNDCCFILAIDEVSLGTLLYGNNLDCNNLSALQTTLCLDYDSDGDGIADVDDNCPDNPNPDQIDSDGDGFGDACICQTPISLEYVLTDYDGNELPGGCKPEGPGYTMIKLTVVGGESDDTYDITSGNYSYEDFPVTTSWFSYVGSNYFTVSLANSPQCYVSQEIVVAYCTDEADSDGDGVLDDVDNCPETPNDDQLDSDNDGVGNVCDICEGDDASGDSDGDGTCDDLDACPLDANKISPGVCGCGIADLDEDQDQIADCIDDCVGTIDVLGVCNGGCTADVDQDGICDDVDDCIGEPDAIGVCGGDCTADVDQDGICDDVDDCIGAIDALGECGGDCTADVDQDGICDDVDDCVGEVDAIGVCNGTCTADNNNNGICDSDEVPSTSTCDNFVYFLSDHNPSDGITDIYQVTLNGGDAELEYVASSEIEVHIAYNSIDNLIYAVSKHTNSYRVLNPYAAVPAFGPTVDLGADYGELTAAVFNADGKLLIGSQNNNAIYSVNVATNVVSPYDTYAPVTGGDIAFGSDGMLYLATRTGNGLYDVWPHPMADQMIGSAPNNVTGLAITDADQLIMSSRGNTNLVLSNTDGSAAGSYAVMLNGEAYTLRDGDMASGCDSHEEVGDDCDYKLYYIHTPAGGGNQPLLEVTLNNDGTASYDAIIANMPGHLGLSPDGSTIYVVNNSSLKVIDVATASVIHSVTIKNVAGQTISSIPAVVVGSDGTLYVGSSSKNQVYTVDPISGTAIPYGPSRTVQGGDLIEADGEIWLITRNNNKFTNVMTSANFTVPVNEINGAAVLDNGNVLLADGNGGSLMKEVDLSTQMVVGTYDIGLPLHNGDLAGNCTMSNPVEEGCYGAEIIDFSQGPQTNGGAVPAGRSDANKALGEPDKSNAAGGFVSLGVGGSITIGFGGVVNDEPGNDIKIYETSFSGDVCGNSDDERADIELSADGVNFVSVGTICRDGEVDMADAGLDHVVAIRITNAASTSSLDGYDVDGVEAINGCGNEPVIIPGECYAAEVVEYIQGTNNVGGAVALDRTDASNALGSPERNNALNYVSLGYGGSLTIAFNGAIPNGEGDDIEVVETTFNFTSVAAYPEYADVLVSVDGIAWSWAGLVDHENRFIDISDAGDFEYVNFVKIVNSDESSTMDGFDVDGVVALHNCEAYRPMNAEVEAQSVLTSYPNPTTGPSEVVFTTAVSGKTYVDVYNMNGSKIATLFNQDVIQGQEYRLDFNGLSLPNGFYVYVLTNNNETTIERFMIAK